MSRPTPRTIGTRHISLTASQVAESPAGRDFQETVRWSILLKFCAQTRPPLGLWRSTTNLPHRLSRATGFCGRGQTISFSRCICIRALLTAVLIRYAKNGTLKPFPSASLGKQGGGAPKGALILEPRPCGARQRADRRALAFRRSTAGSLWRINASAQLRPRFLGHFTLEERIRPSSRRLGVIGCRPHLPLSQSSELLAGRSTICRPGGVRSRPGAGVSSARGHRTRSTFESTLAKGP
jgi:hypothetical protein